MNRPRATSPSSAEAGPPPSGEPLEEFFARHQDELLGLAYYMIGNREDAQDSLQEAFIKCWRHREEVANVRNLRAWVFRIVLNAARDARNTAWRRRRRPLGEGEANLVRTDAGPEADATRREQLTLVRQALTGLRPEEQEVFLLRQNGQMTYEQIAQAIDIPLGTVKTRMRLALTRLREAIESPPQPRVS